MTTREKILSLLKSTGGSSGAAIAARLGLSRQAVQKHLRALVESGRVRKVGATRNVLFSLAKRGATSSLGSSVFRRTLTLKGLAEDEALAQAELAMGLRSALNKNALAIFQYVFTEILNNAIEHAGSREADVDIRLLHSDIQCTIRDFGVGIFESIRSKFGLSEETDAMIELVKGKRTTMPERHAGEGIFFSSKACARLAFRSHGLTLAFDNVARDVFVSQTKGITGTEARFLLSRNAKRTLRSVFDRYAGAEFDYSFSRTEVRVKLLLVSYVSRSEARRLLAGLERFREIRLDFRGVESIGQGFADEVFRVFARSHPDAQIRHANASPAVDAMIRHVVDNGRHDEG